MQVELLLHIQISVSKLAGGMYKYNNLFDNNVTKREREREREREDIDVSYETVDLEKIGLKQEEKVAAPVPAALLLFLML